MRKPRSEYPSEQADKFLLRFPDGLRERIKVAAEANNRSMNAEIVSTLEEKYPAPLTDEEIGLIEHFRKTVERYKLGNKQKDEIISNVVTNEYIALMRRVSDIPDEDLNPAWAAAELHRRISKTLEEKGLSKKP